MRDWTRGVPPPRYAIHSYGFRRATSSTFLLAFLAVAFHRRPSWKTDVTPLCGAPPAVGVTSGGGAERRKPIVASTRPNHLRFCGQAIHVPSCSSRYSLLAHRDRNAVGISTSSPLATYKTCQACF
ncbi:hypothetical protein X777_12728 [Ooceraea biroi]|uniref:Uncharacterized protein n=1 Tax=Ooceraea biroi TaxID=2015173 RepID=A0A026VYG7_OOCBI|nr:hypothetical protein X777_12728 [Ooceraea biroi]